jgi:hypothetical protein
VWVGAPVGNGSALSGCGNTVRPHEALAWERPRDVHLGLADPLTPDFPGPRICRQRSGHRGGRPEGR